MTDTNQLPERLRKAITEIRRKPYPISDLIPLLSAAADALQARAQVQGESGDLHGAIMNLLCKPENMDAEPNQRLAYKVGHRDARHAAAELVARYTTPQPAQATQAEVTEEQRKTVDQIMEQAQVFASAWALVGGRFDSGDALDDAHEAKEELREIVSRAILALRPERVPMTDEQREHFLDGYESAQRDALACRLPPNGWACTRKAGHEGPCAAVPTDDEAFVKRGMDRLREFHHGITAQVKKETP